MGEMGVVLTKKSGEVEGKSRLVLLSKLDWHRNNSRWLQWPRQTGVGEGASGSQRD